MRLGNLAEVSYSLGFSADCRAWLGDFRQAFELADRSMQLALDSNDISRHMTESMRASEERKERPQLAITLLRHGHLYARRGKDDLARRQLERAAVLFSEMGMTWWLKEITRAVAEIR
jgi:hypothetical protein